MKLIDDLRTVHDQIKDAGEQIKAVCDETNNTQMITILLDLANDAYSLALDIEDACETYVELTTPESED